MKRPETHYARSGGLAIAYQVHGGGDYDLLLSAGTGSNIEAVWDIPEAVRLYERLGRFARVIRYDRRDVGLSDPVRDDLTLEAHADDAVAVMDAVGAQRPILMGSLDGARSLALLAATRPTRVSGLIAFAPSARGSAASAPRVRGLGRAGDRGAHRLAWPVDRAVRTAVGDRPGPQRPTQALLPGGSDPEAGGAAAANVADERHHRGTTSGSDADARHPPT